MKKINKIVERLIDQKDITILEGEALLECFWVGVEGTEDNELVPTELQEEIEELTKDVD